MGSNVIPAATPSGENQGSPQASEKPGQFLSRAMAWALLVLILLSVAGIRFRLRAMPLERDEGEYAYAGQLLLQGIPPYHLAYNMKFPGTYVAYALILAVFGQTAAGVHLGLLVVNAAAIVLVYALAARFADRLAGVTAAAVYAYLSLSQGVLGTAAHATHFVVLAALGGLLLLLRGANAPSVPALFCSGLLFGISTLMKQNGAFFALFAACYVLACQWRHRPVRRLAALAAGIATPLAVTALWLWKAGVFGAFWYWTIQYARTYAAGHLGAGEVFQTLAARTPVVILPALMGAAGGLVVLLRKGERAPALFGAGLLVFSALAIFPGFNFRAHYFVLLLPAVSLLSGVAVSGFGVHWRSRGRTLAAVPAAVVGVLLAVGVVAERKLFFEWAQAQAVRLIYEANPFPEAPRIADYLREHAAPDARIAVVGSEPEIYFYARRHSATGFIYTYALVEQQQYALDMQRQMIAEIEDAAPEYLVWVQSLPSWGIRVDRTQPLFQWFDAYRTANYERVGVIEIVSPERTDYFWDDAARNHPPQTPVYLTVFKRKPAG